MALVSTRRTGPGATSLFAVAAVLPVAAVTAAVLIQHGWDKMPCPWCVLQRLIFLGMTVAALPGLLMRSVPVRRLSAAAILLLAGLGIAAALWQHFVAAASASCKLSLADRILTGLGLDAAWPAVFAPMASCADGTVTLLGLPFEYYSLGLFILLAGVAVRLLMRPV